MDKSPAVPVSSRCCWGSSCPCHCFHGVPGSLCWMWTTQVLPSSLPILANTRQNLWGISSPHLWLPVPSETPRAGRDRAPMEIPDLGVLTMKWFVWRSPPGRTLQAKIYGGKKRSLRFGFATRLTWFFRLQHLCFFLGKYWEISSSKNSHYLSGILKGDELQAVSKVPKWFRCSSLAPKSLWCCWNT